MGAFKDKKNNTWYVQFRYKDWQGNQKQKFKRGFATKREAQQFEREFLMKNKADLNMTMQSFVELYLADMKPQLKLSTYLTKENVVRTKILPYFGKRKISEISTNDVLAWQNEIRRLRHPKTGEPFSQTYLKTIHNQLSAIFNHAIKYYDLQINPAQRAGGMGSEETAEMKYWTKEEYERFSEAMMEKDISYYAFELLYWTGIREGELLALTPSDFDLERGTMTISKSYQRLKGQDVITEPKTKNSNRIILLEDFLIEEMKDYMQRLYKPEPNERIFPVTKRYLKHEMERGCKETGVKEIRIHDLRHSHISMLINMGVSALAIGDRVGHKAQDITYRYAHLYPSKQVEMVQMLEQERNDNYVSKNA